MSELISNKGTVNLSVGSQIGEGKTKVIFELPELFGQVLIRSKDRITAGDGAKAHDLVGKAAISTTTTSKIFNILSTAGIKSHFIKQCDETSFIAVKCRMIPIEWVTRRIATGSFLKRHPGVKEGFRFCPVKSETFFKDDANHDPQWSEEQLISAALLIGGVLIGRDEVDMMSRTTVAIFEILEKAWATVDCTLVDMKIEFGVDESTGEILLADVIDSDSWRLWPSGDRRLMKDKQVYRDLKEVTPDALQTVKLNFEWIASKIDNLIKTPTSRVAVFMGSPSDLDYCRKIQKACLSFGVSCELRVASAHKSTENVLKILAEYEGSSIPTVFIAVAGRSNGLGPVLSGNTAWPVINCPPITSDWGSSDIWSSLRLPSGLGCTTVLSPEAAALAAVQIFGLNDHVIWAKLRAHRLQMELDLRSSDKQSRF